MWIARRRSWEQPERAVTPEHLFFDRRAVLAGAASLFAGPYAMAAIGAQPGGLGANEKVTPEAVASNHNNYFDFGSTKQVARAASALKTSPWRLTIDGLCERPLTLDLDDLVKSMPVEERIYRHRCVETWAMVAPWNGFSLRALLDKVGPKSEARYVRFESFLDPKVAPTQRQTWYPWPYVEAITIAEAMNELAFLVTGAYGKPLHPSFGAPLRLALPWKYGFKSIKAIVRISLVAQKPQTFWEKVQGDEYGFWANINPDVPHLRWSQAQDRVIGVNEVRPTKLFNGYGAEVAHLYKDMKGEKLFF